MIDINLLPWREKLRADQKRQKQRQMVGALLLATLIIFLLHLCLHSEGNRVKERLQQMHIRVEKVNKTLEEVKQLYPSLNYQKIPEVDLKLILRKQEELLLFLHKVAEVLPAAIVLRQIRYEKNSWFLQGFSTELPLIFTTLEQLKAQKPDVLNKQNWLDIKEKEGLFYFQFQLES